MGNKYYIIQIGLLKKLKEAASTWEALSIIQTELGLRKMVGATVYELSSEELAKLSFTEDGTVYVSDKNIVEQDKESIRAFTMYKTALLQGNTAILLPIVKAAIHDLLLSRNIDSYHQELQQTLLPKRYDQLRLFLAALHAKVAQEKSKP
mgnify:CR=1 FL=1